jgi:hypothetical protein
VETGMEIHAIFSADKTIGEMCSEGCDLCPCDILCLASRISWAEGFPCSFNSSATMRPLLSASKAFTHLVTVVLRICVAFFCADRGLCFFFDVCLFALCIGTHVQQSR